MITLLYENSTSSGCAILVPSILLYTGTDVLAIIKMAAKKKTREPMNIQNSREFVLSSLCIDGIFFKFTISKIIEGNVNDATKRKIITLMAWPASVKACTDVSPKIPVRVKKVE